MPTKATRIEPFDTPQPVPLDRLLDEQVTALIVAGIVNPMGPTLTAVVALGSLGADKRLPVIHMILNPFSQEAWEVGELALGKSWTISEVIPAVFSLPFGSCPTLLLSSGHLNATDRLRLHAEFLRGFPGANRVLTGVRRYLGKPFERVSSEMNGPASGGSEPLNDTEASELAELLSSEQHWKQEVVAFFYAWDGAIDFQRTRGMPALAATAMSSDTFKRLFLHISRTCA